MYFLLIYRVIWLKFGDVSSELLTARRHVDLRRPGIGPMSTGGALGGAPARFPRGSAWPRKGTS
ncbi:hypothetical protein GCM10010156_32890 [Planobispora rosea]|uniref:Uncharacterized protein n=1 Tax=Planobispora rosea TaxID=35762 RepID=A0A8J3WE27_PLARO|nr:hypothetical protein GCM10010156_32890 [Planobispora rosea]GIH85472.1 hypothetical protein Pro02_38800 [Planobispora rosea]